MVVEENTFLNKQIYNYDIKGLLMFDD